jgi:general stress protein 26
MSAAPIRIAPTIRVTASGTSVRFRASLAPTRPRNGKESAKEGEQYPESKLWEMMADIRTCMLTARRGDRLESRPMTAYVNEGDRAIWFITLLDSEKTREIEEGETVNVAFADIEDETYISLTGTARVLRDVARQKAMWNPFAEAWLPQGPESPDVGLIRVDPIEASYWDSPSSTVVQLWQVVVANVTQTPPEPNAEGKVRLG